MKKLALILCLLICLSPILASTEIVTAGRGFVVALLDYDPSPAQPGQYVTIYLKVENRGDEIKDALYKLEPEYPFSLKPGEDPERYFGTIGSYQQILLEYDLFVAEDAPEGTYPIKIKLCTDENCTTSVEKEIEITVQTGGTPGIEVGLEDFDIFSGGKRGKVTIHVVNRGDLDVKYLVIELLPTEQFDIISPSRIYIGEMESDDFETAEFEIYVHENVAKDVSQKIQLPVYLDYTDANDKKYSESQSVYLKVYSQSDLIKMGLKRDYDKTKQYFILGVSAIVALFLIYRFYKKRQEE